MKLSISEDLVVHIWQSVIFPELVTTTGEAIKVIYPGRFTPGQAGDFQDAVLLIDGQKVYGNIEAHVRSSQWYSHGHHYNPRYNNTLLHITYLQDKKIPTMLHNGTIIPTITLNTFLTKQHINLMTVAKVPTRDPLYCPHTKRFPVTEQLLDVLAIAGNDRFYIKANSYLQALRKMEPDQVLFTSLSRSLGYSQNSQAFERLANQLKLSSLEQSNLEKETTQQALLMGTAGLLPSQRSQRTSGFINDRRIEELEQNWKVSGLTDSMDETDWCFFRVRPANFPTRRIAALSYFLNKYQKTGLMNGMLNLFLNAPREINYGQLANSLAIPAKGYWANHCDFTTPMVKTSAIIGHNKAVEILVNTALPFAYAWSQSASEFKLERKLEEFYRSLPKSADNELTRYMKQQLRVPDKHLSACHQQGLIHIFKIHCRYRDCTLCPVAIN
jgi:hypothetical protein